MFAVNELTLGKTPVCLVGPGINLFPFVYQGLGDTP